MKRIEVVRVSTEGIGEYRAVGGDGKESALLTCDRAYAPWEILCDLPDRFTILIPDGKDDPSAGSVASDDGDPSAAIQGWMEHAGELEIVKARLDAKDKYDKQRDERIAALDAEMQAMMRGSDPPIITAVRDELSMALAQPQPTVTMLRRMIGYALRLISRDEPIPEPAAPPTASPEPMDLGRPKKQIWRAHTQQDVEDFYAELDRIFADFKAGTK
jgi:hypothetical protein